jgi:arginine:agmatine antiporter
MMAKEQRKIGLFYATMLVAGNIIGTGIYLLPAQMAPTGTISSLGWIVTVPAALSLALVFATLGMFSPLAGGPYAYARETLGPWAGFQCAVFYWVSNVIGNTAIAVAAVSYLVTIVPALRSPLSAVIATIVIIWLAAFVNAIGPRIVATVESYTLLLGLLPIVGVGVVGWFWFDPELFLSAWNPAGVESSAAISAAAGNMFFAFMGMESAAVAARVVADPQRNVPRATLIGVIIAAVVYMLSTTAIAGILPNEELQNSLAPFERAIAVMAGPVGGGIFGMFLVIKAFGSLGGWTLMVAETAKAAADDNMFPAAFSKTNSRGVPVIGLYITAAIMSACLLLAVVGSVGRAFDSLVSSSVLMALVPYIFSATAVGYFVRGKVSERAHWALVAVAVVAAAFCVWLITTADKTSILLVVVLTLVMGPLYRLYVQTSGRKAKAASPADSREERT